MAPQKPHRVVFVRFFHKYPVLVCQEGCMVRVLAFTTWFPWGRASGYPGLVQLVEEFAQGGHESRVVFPADVMPGIRDCSDLQEWG